MNGATEQTLAELLATANAMNINLVKLNKIADEIRKNGGTGGTAASSAAAGLASIAKAASPLSMVLNAITTAGDAVGAVFGAMGSIIGKTIGVISNVTGELVSFAVKAAEGKAKLSDLFAAFKDLPLGFGTLANVMAQIVRYSEGLLATYQKLTAAGASFSGDLFTMRGYAARAQMSMEEFANVVNANSEFFSTMGGNVQKGIDKFVLAQSALMGPNSPYATSILNLGVSAEEAGQFLVSMIKSQGVMGKQGAADAATLARYTAEYITELDELSKITGKRREQIDAEVQKAEQDDAWQLFMDSLTPDEAAKAKSMLAIAETYNGKAGVEQMKLSLRGIDAPIGKLSQGLAVASGGISTSGEQYRKALKDGSISIEQASRATTRGQLEIAAGVGKFAKTIGTEGLAAGAGINLLNSASVATARKLDAAGGSQEKMIAMAKKQQEDQAKSSAAQLAQAQQSIRNFGNTITEIATRFVGPLAGKLAEFGNSIMQTVAVFVASDGFQKKVQAIADWFGTAFKDLQAAYNAGGMESLMKAAGEKLKEGAKNVWEVVGPPLKAGLKFIWDEIRPALIEGFTKLIEFIKPYFQEIGLSIKESLEDYLKKETRGVLGTSDEANARRGTEDWAKSSQEYQSWLKRRQDLATETGSSVAMDRYFNTRLHRDDLIKEFMEETKNRTAAMAELQNKAEKYVPGRRDLGTLGMTGKTSEPFDTNVNLEKGERVLNPAETAAYNNQANALNQLNNLTAQLLQVMKDNNEYSRRILNATEGLNGNLFA